MQYIFSLLLTFLLMQCYSGVENNINDDISNDIDIVDDIIISPRDERKIPHLEIAKQNIGYPPQDSINAWLSFVNLPPNNNWCAAAQSTWLHQAKVKEPLLRTGLARNYIYNTPNRLHISAGRVLIGITEVPKGSLVVFKRGETMQGHIGTITENWRGESGYYISGNVQNGGVFVLPEKIIPSDVYRITHFVYVNY